MGLILAECEKRDRSWFSLLLGLIFEVGGLFVLRLLIPNRALDFHGMDL